jgi:hypothetical protein
MTDKYKIVRMYQRGGHRTIESGLTLEEAQEHCRNPETSSKTAIRWEARKLTEQKGPWFDGYERD